ncbi:hydrogenase, subunit gamma protein [Dehalobacter sp. UNSWDHB]|jgi:2-polyprenylphenol hydroxylase and related flavodoxin oxidoreductases|uniref:sulfide/dihydroorotate dehydrogenase-like FAD/NAD-binding protein n=1 Tax=unclassified Dehalobacter TaxID=2635733 RepID=UPI00028A97F0|nr:MULTISPECIES: sulfide/dihydroorotate dehydrogenase-like FAD/NAD-binding protein [unclassified Dehalobacter]AFV03256.1 2-polyprenylphenol hydroxylase-related flavodoxin oxidoreductase [Dehalobacter sp. DCA]AFV06242.1 2-polyprenylphenol hydroxylase-related flavodoxin oxidoreductase [Dehalobacter sp. CF]EQB21003.1 hydrogenase, subunit gamma protein [Dehalobacter sp. UNSWDHB]
MFTVVKKQQLSETIVLLEVLATEVAKKAQPGEFVIVRQNEDSERIPLTIMDFNREKGTITIVIQEAGYSSHLITRMREGDSFVTFVGPLGQETEIENYGTVLCIGGGVGIAPVHPIARALKEAGNKVISILGARSKGLLILEEEMRAVSDEVVITTDDGSYGMKGFVTHGIQSVLDRGIKVDAIWAIGPVVMMKSVANFTKPLGIKTIVSMNPVMVDGTGMCGACRLDVGGETKFACVDGPEFDGHKVDFDLAMKRSAFYKTEEAVTYNKIKHECQCTKEGK